MNFDESVLIHYKTSFERSTLEARFKKLKFNNLARMELFLWIFLWNLEIFVQIQNALKDKVVLKGGAAAQLYLPVKYQRTSVDIDMICTATPKDIEDTLAKIEKKFNGTDNLFKAQRHYPKDPKTVLPLLTYYMKVPSVCTRKELFGGTPGFQEIKIEFNISKDAFSINFISSPDIFALKTDKTYQVLPLNILIGDKLTTLGPNTIGIPAERSDEQIKQIYDITSLIDLNWRKINFDEVREAFIKSAKSEAKQRGLRLNMGEIFSDMLGQMERLSHADMEKDDYLTKLINDFQSLYVRKSLNKSVGEWAIGGAKLKLIIKCLAKEIDLRQKLDIIAKIENNLKFGDLEGAKKGEVIKRFKNDFSLAFEKYSNYPAKILKGKNPTRIVWTVVSEDNVGEIAFWIDNFTRSNC